MGESFRRISVLLAETRVTDDKFRERAKKSQISRVYGVQLENDQRKRSRHFNYVSSLDLDLPRSLSQRSRHANRQ